MRFILNKPKQYGATRPQYLQITFAGIFAIHCLLGCTMAYIPYDSNSVISTSDAVS